MEAVRREFKEGKLVIGTSKTLKMLRDGKISRVYITNSTPKETKLQIKDVDVKKLRISATELGKFLGKTFPIAVCGVKK